ncbi:hypothetical protein [Pseudomonas sp. 2FG]|nr:hypothetical protein [Pseudomonas sp. 2FG]
MFEIAGCYAFWLWLRMGKSGWLGAALCVLGASVILLGPRFSQS